MSASSSPRSPHSFPPDRRVNTAMVREANLQLLVSVLRNHGPMSRAEIVRRSGLTRPTVLAIVNVLLGSETIVETGPDSRRATPGRPGVMLAFNPRVQLTAACELQDTTVEVVLADADGEILHEASSPLDHHSPDQALEQVARAVLALAARHKVGDRLGAVGVLLPGIVDPALGVCHYSAPFGWRDVAISAPLASRLGVPVVALNRAHAAALGEVAYGSHEGRNLVSIFLDRGIGAGIVSDGRLITGSAGMAGSEIGHVRVVDRGARCVCGRTGCLATVASGRHIVKRAGKILGRPTGEPLRIADLEGQNPEIDQLLSEAARWLGIAASWLINAVAPKVVVLGGPPLDLGSSRFFTEFRRTALRRSLLPDENLEIVLSRLGGRSDLHGALRAAQEQLPATFAPPRSFVAPPIAAVA